MSYKLGSIQDFFNMLKIYYENSKGLKILYTISYKTPKDDTFLYYGYNHRKNLILRATDLELFFFYEDPILGAKKLKHYPIEFLSLKDKEFSTRSILKELLKYINFNTMQDHLKGTPLHFELLKIVTYL